MKVSVKLHMTPEEARRLMGLPDVGKVNDAYVDQMAEFVSDASSVEQLQNFTKMVAPMGEAGMRMFSSFLSGAMGGNMTSDSDSGKSHRKKRSDDSKKTDKDD